ncbi:MAG: hypothetical protein M3220_21540 [Chloroflexota bacterium]|nr:hypothetical protein [Chloroflexota bacterium]
MMPRPSQKKTAYRRLFATCTQVLKERGTSTRGIAQIHRHTDYQFYLAHGDASFH